MHGTLSPTCGNVCTSPSNENGCIRTTPLAETPGCNKEGGATGTQPGLRGEQGFETCAEAH